MDRVLIDTYRNIDIYFDLDREKFYASIDDVNYSKDKQSYAASKKTIDDFIKENVEFKPFYVVKVEFWSGKIEKRCKIIGIRKDGRYIYENEKGEIKQIESYYEKNYVVEGGDYIPLINKIKILEEQIKPLACEKNVLIKELEKLPNLDSVKAKYHIK